MTSACTSLDAGFAFQLPRSLMPFVDATRDWIIKRIEPSAPKTFPPSYTSLEPLNPTVEMPHSTKGLDSEKLAYYTVQYDATSEVNRKILASIKAYRHPLGFEGDLVNAAWQIVDMGEIAWPALCNLAKSSMPELEYFLAPIFRIEGISPIERMTPLRSAAKNPSPNVRSRLLELADELPEPQCSELLRAIASGEIQDDISNCAIDKLGGFNS